MIQLIDLKVHTLLLNQIFQPNLYLIDISLWALSNLTAVQNEKVLTVIESIVDIKFQERLIELWKIHVDDEVSKNIAFLFSNISKLKYKKQIKALSPVLFLYLGHSCCVYDV